MTTLVLFLVSFDCFSLFLHVLISLIKLILWLESSTGKGHGAGVAIVLLPFTTKWGKLIKEKVTVSYMRWRRHWHPTPVLLSGKPCGWRSLVGCSPWGREEWDTTKRLPFHFSLSCIGEGNGNPLQCSCLENPRDGGAWWAAVYGVAQGQTRLKWLSSCSSNYMTCLSRTISASCKK